MNRDIVFELNNISELHYQEWFLKSTKRQAEDRSFVNGTAVGEEFHKLQEIIPLILPRGKDSKGHYFKLLSTPIEQNAGFIWFGTMPGVANDTIVLMDIIVKDHLQGQGLGKAMLLSMHKEMKEAGYRKIMLNVLNHNPAKHLYVKLGYLPVKETAKETIMEIEL